MNRNWVLLLIILAVGAMALFIWLEQKKEKKERMNKEFDTALKNWDYEKIARLNGQTSKGRSIDEYLGGKNGQ